MADDRDSKWQLIDERVGEGEGDVSVFTSTGYQKRKLHNVVVHKAESMLGEALWKMDGEHSFHVCAPFETVTPCGVDGRRMIDQRWRAGSVGYLPPDVTINGVATVPADLLFVRIPTSLFMQAAKESVSDPASVDLRFLPDLDDPIAASLCETLDRAAKDLQMENWPLLAESIGLALATRMLHHLGAPPKRQPEGNLAARMRRVREYVEEYLTEPLGLEELANVAAMSPYHFARSFRRAMGVTPIRYVWLRRLERAKEALRDPGISLAAVAAMCGFSSQSHFSAAFKKETGVTPKRFRDTLIGGLLASLGLLDLFESAARVVMLA